jgi:hypothetical protein
MTNKLKVGDIITLEWNGYLGVPMYRNYDKATILEFKRKRIVIETNGIIYKILPNQIRELKATINQ